MDDILEKIRKIEALIEGAQTKGERLAATSARERVRKKLKDIPQKVEYSLYTQDNWHKKLLLAICRKYEIVPYRYKRQKYTTVMVMVREDFLQDVLWPEYLEYSKHLEQLVEDITDRLISQIHDDEGGEEIVHGQLGG